MVCGYDWELTDGVVYVLQIFELRLTINNNSKPGNESELDRPCGSTVSRVGPSAIGKGLANVTAR